MLMRLGLSRLVCVALVVALLLIVGDFIWHFGHVARFLSLGILLAAVVAVVIFDLIRPLGHSWSRGQVLDYLDRVLPGGDDRLTNLAELRDIDSIAEAESAEGRALVDSAVADLEQTVGGLRLRVVVDRGIVRRWLRLAAGVVVVCIAVASACQFATREPYTEIGVRRLLMPWDTVRWPSSTWFELVTPKEDTSVPEGEDFAVRAMIQGRTPNRITLTYNNVDDEGQATSRDVEVTMFVRDGVAEYTFNELSDSIRFRIEGGDGQTDAVNVHVVKRPFVSEVAAYYKFPPYSGAPPKISSSPQLTGLEGTEVRLKFTASRPLSQAWVQLTGQERVSLPLDESGLHFEWLHQLADTTTYNVGLLDRFGNREKQAETYRIKVTPDRPPTARIIAPPGDLNLTARAHFEVQYEVADDYGLQQVRFMVARDDEPPQPLSEKITGPVRQIGKRSVGSFQWDLQRIDLDGVQKLTWFIAAQDVNPTGRGKAESGHLQLTLRSELELQSDVLLAAKGLLTEAVLGSNNQRWAYLDAVKWRSTDGQMDEDKTLLAQMLDEQAVAARAAAAMEVRLKTLRAEMARNRMDTAFFARRLEQIGQLVHDMATKRQPEIAAALDTAKPANASEDTPEGQVAKMKQALTDLEPTQKRAVLEYRRLLYLLQDWNDLQNVLVKSRRLKDLQEKVYRTSFEVAPRWIGKEIEDLTEDDARLLTTLGQQQDAIHEAETALEEELQTLALAARAQQRKQVFTPLKESLELLRLRAVGDRLIQCARGIKDNRVDSTLEDQQYVAKVFTFVAAKFEQAGEDVAQLVSIDMSVAILDDRKVEAVAVRPPTAIGDAGAEPLVFDPESTVDVEDIGAYKVNTIEQALVFLQSVLDDQVLLYTRYTDQKFKQKPRSSRYRRLRLGMLGVRVGRALDSSGSVLDYAKDHPFDAALPYLQSLHADLDGVGRLVGEGQIGPATQALQQELSVRVQTARRFLAGRGKAIAEIEDRRKSQDLDEFGQRYVVTGSDVAALANMREQLGWAVVLQTDVNEKSRRLAEYGGDKMPKEPLLDEFNIKANSERATRQDLVVQLVGEVVSVANNGLTEEELRQRVVTEELAALDVGGFKEAVSSAKSNDARSDLIETLRTALANLDALADERVRVKEELATEVVEAQQAIEQVDLKKSPEEMAQEIATARDKALHDFKFEVIAERVKNSSLDEHVQQYLLKSLAQNPDPKYRKLVSAYFNSLLPRGEKEEKQP